MSRWRRVAAKVASFSLADWSVLIEAAATLIVVQIALRLVDFPRLLAWTTRRMPGPERSAEQVHRLAWLVGIAGRLLRRRCLTRSLALTHVLGRRGIATEMRIGVHAEGGRLAAHAWVEWLGRALDDDARTVQQFVPFSRGLGDSANA